MLDGLGFLFQWEAITELVSSDHQLQIIYGRNLSNQNSANSQKRVDFVSNVSRAREIVIRIIMVKIFPIPLFDALSFVVKVSALEAKCYSLESMQKSTFSRTWKTSLLVC